MSYELGAGLEPLARLSAAAEARNQQLSNGIGNYAQLAALRKELQFKREAMAQQSADQAAERDAHSGDLAAQLTAAMARDQAAQRAHSGDLAAQLTAAMARDQAAQRAHSGDLDKSLSSQGQQFYAKLGQDNSQFGTTEDRLREMQAGQLANDSARTSIARDELAHRNTAQDTQLGWQKEDRDNDPTRAENALLTPLIRAMQSNMNPGNTAPKGVPGPAGQPTGYGTSEPDADQHGGMTDGDADNNPHLSPGNAANMLTAGLRAPTSTDAPGVAGPGDMGSKLTELRDTIAAIKGGKTSEDIAQDRIRRGIEIASFKADMEEKNRQRKIAADRDAGIYSPLELKTKRKEDIAKAIQLAQSEIAKGVPAAQAIAWANKTVNSLESAIPGYVPLSDAELAPLAEKPVGLTNMALNQAAQAAGGTDMATMLQGFLSGKATQHNEHIKDNWWGPTKTVSDTLRAIPIAGRLAGGIFDFGANTANNALGDSKVRQFDPLTTDHSERAKQYRALLQENPKLVEDFAAENGIPFQQAQEMFKRQMLQ